MATTREQFIALRKSGMTPVQAREEVMKTVTPTSPTANANVAQLEANKTKVQAEIQAGTRPEVGTSVTPVATQAPTPVLPTAPTTTPNGATMNADGTVTPVTTMPQKEVKQFSENGELINPTAQDIATYNQNVQTFTPSKDVQPAKQVTPKVEAPIDYNQAQGREQDIIKNLDTFKTQNMTPEQIMRASDYQNATPEKKALIDPYLKQQVPTASAMYNAIASKADIPDEQKTTLPFKIAQNRYTKASSFSTMTASQLANEMDNSRFIQGSQAYEDVKAMNPKLVQDTENLRIVNGKKQNIFTYVNNPDGTSTKVNNLEKTFAEDYMDNFGETIKKLFAVQTPEQIRAIIYTDDVKKAQDKASEIELTMNELEKQMDNVDDDVDKELAGSGATGSRIALEKAIRKDKLGKEYNSQLKNYTTYANKANNLITQNTTAYTTQQQQQQAQSTAMLPFLTDQYKTAQEKFRAEEALNDPAVQIKATMDEFAKLGIVAQGDLTSKIAEFKASGKTLPEYITGLRQQFMSKPEYKKIQELQAGQLSDVQKVTAQQNFDIQKIKLQDSMKDKNIQRVGGTDSNPIYGYMDGNKLVTVSVPGSTSTGTTPTGNIVPVTAGNKTVRLDQVGAKGFESAINQLKTAGIPIVVGEGHRNQTDTIKSMADRYGIPFNASNPAETAGKLRKAGHQVADPGKSNHESGMAIDVYGSSKLDAVTPAQEKILNANGWYSAGIPGDAGHFEYRGGGTGTQANTPIAQLGQFMKDNQQRGPGYSEEDVKAFNAKIDRFVQNGDQKGIATAFRNNLFQDKDFKQEFDNTKKFTTALDSVQTLLNDYEKAGKSTNALNGMAEKVARKLGLTTDQALAQLQTQMGFTLANYIKSISGTAASDVEVQRLMGNMANISNVKDLNTTILSQVKSNADSSLKSMIETRMYGMPEDLKYDVFADVYKKNPVNNKLTALTNVLSNIFKNAPKQ